MKYHFFQFIIVLLEILKDPQTEHWTKISVPSYKKLQAKLSKC